MYSQKVMDHLANPRNVGIVPQASAVGMAKSPVDKDTLLITLRIANEIITEIRFQCAGCGAAVACASVATEMVKGKTVADAERISPEAIVQALDGLPGYKAACGHLAPEAIKLAIAGWRKKRVPDATRAI